MEPPPPKSLAELRVEYSLARLDEHAVEADPIKQFEKWFADACAAQVPEPNAMVLATATPEAGPSTRTVLLKGLDSGMFSFFTNYGSEKAASISAFPQVAATFLWLELQRQVNLRGKAVKATREEAAAYFATRPYESQLGAHASNQSTVIPDRAWLEARFAEAATRFPAGSVPLPENWGGFRIVPTVIEFWQGRSSRLHDRIRYTRQNTTWRIERLAP